MANMDISRANKLNWINIALYNASNNQIHELFNIFTEDIKYDDDMLNRQRIVNFVIVNMRAADDKTIDNMYAYSVDNELLDDNGVYYVKVKKLNEKINDSKNTITLKIINEIFDVTGKEKIERLEDFKNIRKEDLADDECKSIIENNKDYILTKFTKSDIRYSHRNFQKSFTLSCIRGMVNNLDNYTFVSKAHKNMKITDKNNKPNYTTYSIEIVK